MRKALISGVALAVAATLTGCGGSSGGSASKDCTDATDVGQTIAQRIDGGSLVDAKAVKMPDRKNVYAVAVKFSAEGVDDQVGVWAANDLTDPGTIFALDGTATQFSDYADGTAQGIESTDPSVSAARSCF